MLSLFPSLLPFGLLAPFLLRLVLALTCLHFSYKHIKRDGRVFLVFGLVQGICGVLILIGLFTQAAALALVIIFGLLIIKQIMNKTFLTDGVNYYLLLFVISLSLMFSGAGAFAFDLPI